MSLEKKTNRGYLNPLAEGYLLEAKACKKVCKELRRIAEKLQRAVARERAARQAEFETAVQYQTEDDIQEAYGWGVLSEAQYKRYMDIFRDGQAALENAPATMTETSLKITLRILSDIAAEQCEWEFSALTPAEQQAEIKRAEASQLAWKQKLAELKRQYSLVDADQSEDGEDCKTQEGFNG